MGNRTHKTKKQKSPICTLVSRPLSHRSKTECVKVLLLGDPGVGKTSIMLRFVDNTFSTQPSYVTHGVDFKTRTLCLNDHDRTVCKVQLWDTGGQECFRSITSSFYRGAHLIFLVYDVTRYSTFKNIQHWLTEVNRYAADHVMCVVIGNKSDCDHVPIDRRNLARRLNGDTYYDAGIVSARNNTHIDTVFVQALVRVVEKRYTHV